MLGGCKSVRHKECYCSQKGPGYENGYSCVSVLADAHRFDNALMPFLVRLSAVEKRREAASLLDTFLKCNAPQLRPW